MILVHASPTTLEPYRRENLGVLCSPRRVYGKEMNGWPWAADNDAYSEWDAGRYVAMLDKITGRNGCLFVTLPDKVGDAAATNNLAAEWLPIARKCRQPLAVVAQDGHTVETFPWRVAEAVFIGGTDEFKMGPEAKAIVYVARLRGLWVHMGRVNGHQRMRYAKSLGCDSVDGTSLSWFRDRWLAEFLDHAAAPTQEALL